MREKYTYFWLGVGATAGASAISYQAYGGEATALVSALAAVTAGAFVLAERSGALGRPQEADS